MKLKHTQGPWEWSKGCKLDGDYCIILDSEGETILLHKAQWGIKLGDRKLIAAAPEMLEALIFHMKYNCASFKSCWRKNSIEGKTCNSRNNCRYIKSAELIEKATGQKIEDILKEEK